MANIKVVRLDVAIPSLTLASVLLVSCAGTAGSHTVVKSLEDSSALKRYSHLVVDAKSAPGVPNYPQVMTRIVNLITLKTRQHELNHFTSFNDEAKQGSALQASLLVTRYDKGDKWARFMLAGMGQIHIDALLKLRDLETQELLAEYVVNKTFAWGGAYGVSVTMADVQEGFAETVVEILLLEGS